MLEPKVVEDINMSPLGGCMKKMSRTIVRAAHIVLIVELVALA